MKKSEVMQNKYNELARLFGANYGTKTSRACTGKYRGTYDYSITFDNGVRYFISNGMKSFEKILDEAIKSYSEFYEHKAEIMEILKELEQFDRGVAGEQGVKDYTLKDIELITSGNDYIGWFELIIEVDGTLYRYKETNLYIAILDGVAGVKKFVENKKQNSRFFVDGRARADGVDIVISNVGINLKELKPAVKRS